jgi:hypothetical protein
MAQLKAGTTIGGVEPILKDVLHAHTIMVANADHTPIELTVLEGRLVGRKTGGNIDDLTGQEAADIVSAYLATPITPQTVASAFTDAHGFPDFLWNGQEDFAPVKVPTDDCISGGWNSSFFPYKAFDGSDATYWETARASGHLGLDYIGVKNLKRNIKAIKYLNYSATANNMTSVKIDYSTDGGITWTNIQTTTVVNTANAWNEITVAAYAGGDAGLHAIRILANANLTGTWVIFTVILLYNSNLDVCTTGNAVKYDENGSYPATNAFDNIEGGNPYNSTANMSGGLLYIGQSGVASAVKAVRYKGQASGPKEIRLSWKQNVGDGWTDLATIAMDGAATTYQTFYVPSYSPSGSHYFAIRPTTNCAPTSP